MFVQISIMYYTYYSGWVSTWQHSILEFANKEEAD